MYGLYLLLSLATTTFGIKNLEKKCVGVNPKTFSPSEKIIYHKLGDKIISLKVSRYGELINTCCINLHDDEMTAVNAARSVLEDQGGVLIKIENNGKRNISFPLKGVVYTFDPNRIFSHTGIILTLKANGKISTPAVTEVEKFATHLLELIPTNIPCLIALHNNSNGNFSIKTYMPGGTRQNDACQVYSDEWQDIDDIALTTDQTIYNKMAAFGYNSILQDNDNVLKDGSLSVYYGEQKKRYINIETEHGRTKQYVEMMKKLLHILDEEKNSLASQVFFHAE